MATETKTQHTPGPWKVETVETSVGICHKIGPFPGARDEENYACLYVDGAIPGHSEANKAESELRANARLIAAAPELLEALEECEAALEIAVSVIRALGPEADWPDSSPRKGLHIARAAIAKARGES